MISLDNITKKFDDITVVDGLSFSVDKGEVLGFLGPNGAGKSTTMKMITGFLTPTSGRIEVLGHDVVKRPMAVKNHIGYLPEGAPAYGDMGVRDFLQFVAQVRGIRAGELNSKVDEAIDRLSLGNAAHKRIETLSKGFKRRVGIAQAIIHDPPVLIMDEPTDGLDPNQKHEVRQLIANLASDKIIVISTHILEEVEAVCSRAIIIAEGKLVADDTPLALQARSKYHKAVTLQLKQPKDLTAALESLPKASAIEVGDEQRRYRILPSDGEALVDQVMSVVQQHQAEIEQVYIESGDLDDVFRNITRAQA